MIKKRDLTNTVPQMIEKRDVTDRVIQLTSFGAKNVTLLTGGSNWPPLVQKTLRYRQGDPTNLLDV